MKITAIEPRSVQVNRRGNWLFLQIMTDAGLVGSGEASHGGAGPDRDGLVAAIVRRQVAPLLVGEDPTRVRRLLERLRPVATGLPGWTALSAIEQALWDLVGQVAGQPVWRLLGGAVRESIPVYANINRAIEDRRASGFATAAQAAVGEGYTAVKCAPFDGVTPLAARDRVGRALVWAGIERVAAVHQAIGPTNDLYVDCHGRFDVATAVWVGRELERLGVRWFEEPVPTEDQAALAQVRAKVAIELVGGEHLTGLAAALPYLQANLFGTLMPDIKHCGGIASLLAIGEVAAAYGVAIAPHNPSGPIALAASLQVAALLPQFRILEVAWGEVPWRSRLVTPAEQIVGGAIALPDGPGLGSQLVEEELSEHEILV